MKVYVRYNGENNRYEISGVYKGKQYITTCVEVKHGKLRLCAEIINDNAKIINDNTKPITFDFVNITHVKHL
jgi:hypothetical protein